MLALSPQPVLSGRYLLKFFSQVSHLSSSPSSLLMYVPPLLPWHPVLSGISLFILHSSFSQVDTSSSSFTASSPRHLALPSQSFLPDISLFFLHSQFCQVGTGASSSSLRASTLRYFALLPPQQFSQVPRSSSSTARELRWGTGTSSSFTASTLSYLALLPPQQFSQVFRSSSSTAVLSVTVPRSSSSTARELRWGTGTSSSFTASTLSYLALLPPQQFSQRVHPPLHSQPIFSGTSVFFLPQPVISGSSLFVLNSQFCQVGNRHLLYFFYSQYSEVPRILFLLSQFCQAEASSYYYGTGLVSSLSGPRSLTITSSYLTASSFRNEFFFFHSTYISSKPIVSSL